MWLCNGQVTNRLLYRRFETCFADQTKSIAWKYSILKAGTKNRLEIYEGQKALGDQSLRDISTIYHRIFKTRKYSCNSLRL